MTDCGWIVRALMWFVLGGALGLAVGLAIGYAYRREQG